MEDEQGLPTGIAAELLANDAGETVEGEVQVACGNGALTVTGPLTDYVSRADSGSTMHRRFCAECGTPLFSEAEQRPHQIIVRAGALDDPSLAKPATVIWTKSAPTWACFDPSLPQAEGQASAPKG